MKSLILVLIGVIILIVIAWGTSSGWRFFGSQQEESSPTQPTSSEKSSPSKSSNKNQMNVSVEKSIFDPVELKVPLGTTVSWSNNDTVSQAIISDIDVFQSPELEPGESFSYTFNQKGEYPYYEIGNGEMKAKIQVENSS